MSQNKFGVGAPTAQMAKQGLSWDPVKAFVRHSINVLQSQGETGLAAFETGMRLVAAVTNRDVTGIFAAANQGKDQITQIIDAVKAEFGIE